MSTPKSAPMGGLNLEPDEPESSQPPAAPVVDPRRLRDSLGGAEVNSAELHRRVTLSTAGKLPSLTPVTAPPTRTEMVHLTAVIPLYVREDLRLRAAREKTSQRYLLLTGLRAIGIEVRDEDLVEDGRNRPRR
jgi:hypothetical protein